MIKVGILTSGGDCQGLNSAIRGVAKALYQEFGKDVEIYGIQDGYYGLIEGEYKKWSQRTFPVYLPWAVQFWEPHASPLRECGTLTKTMLTRLRR